MDLKNFFLEQLEMEVAANRKALERTPENRNDWKPHPKSMPLGYLAVLVATMPAWVAMMIEQDEMNLAAPRSGPTAANSRAELLKLLDESASQGRQALQNTTEQHLMKPWRLLRGTQVMTEGPKYVMLMNGVFSHLAHHRGQLTVYLRLNEQSVPALYGPSADEQY